MASLTRFRMHAAPDLAPGEEVVAAAHAQPKGMYLIIAPGAGVGAAIGYLVATAGASSMLRAAIGGGVGAAAGVVVATVIGMLVFRSRAPFGSLYSTLVRTSDRLLVYGRSGATNRPRGLIGDSPLAETPIVVGERRFFLPRSVTVTLPDGSVHALEVAGVEKPERITGAE